MPNYQQGSGQSVPLQDFAPDLPSDTPGILLDANNAIPTTKGYKARNTPVQVAPAVPQSPIRGCYMAYYSDQSTSIIVAAGNNIYRLGFIVSTGTSTPFWANANASTPITPTGLVQFTQFNDDVLAVGPGMPTLVATGNAGVFTPLIDSATSTNAPAGTNVLSVAGTVVVYNTSVGFGSWWNSGFGQDTYWQPNIQVLSASGTLYDYPGPIVAAAPIFRAQVVFKKNAIWLGTFTGAPFVWNFQLISAETGTWGQGCVCVLPDSIAFLGIDDFYVCTGYTPTRIPNNLRRFFFQTVNQPYLPNVTSWYDDVNATVYWHYCSMVAPSPPNADRWVAYNIRVGKWS